MVEQRGHITAITFHEPLCADVLFRQQALAEREPGAKILAVEMSALFQVAIVVGQRFRHLHRQ